MKQYKEQVDGYVGQVEEMTAEMEGLKTELQAYQQQAVLYREQVGILTNISCTILRGRFKGAGSSLYLKDSCLCSICQLGQIEHMFYLP